MLSEEKLVFATPLHRFLACIVDGALCGLLWLIASLIGLDGARLLLFCLGAGWVVFIFPIISLGSSLGMRWAGLVVYDYNLSKLRSGRASCRALLAILSAGFFGMGFLLFFFTRRRQTLHDLYTHTLVLEKEQTESPLTLGREWISRGKKTEEENSSITPS